MEAEIASGAASAPRRHPGSADRYRQKAQNLHQAPSDPRSQDEAPELLRSLIGSAEMRSTGEGLEIELVSEIARMVQAALQQVGDKDTSFSEHAVCSVELVAGARNQLYLLLAASPVPKPA